MPFPGNDSSYHFGKLVFFHLLTLQIILMQDTTVNINPQQSFHIRKPSNSLSNRVITTI